MNRRFPVKARYKAKKPLKFRVVNKFLFEKNKCVGQCYPGTKKYLIEIDPRQCPREYMDTLIHEALHELLPKKKEKSVLRAGTSIANLLWKLGYRRVRKKK